MGGGALGFGAFDQVQKPRQAFVEHGSFQAVDHRLPNLARGDQPGAPQEREVVRHGGLAEGELLGDLARRQVSPTEQVEDMPPGGIVERAEKAIHRYFDDSTNIELNQVPKKILDDAIFSENIENTWKRLSRMNLPR